MAASRDALQATQLHATDPVIDELDLRVPASHVQTVAGSADLTRQIAEVDARVLLRAPLRDRALRVLLDRSHANLVADGCQGYGVRTQLRERHDHVLESFQSVPPSYATATVALKSTESNSSYRPTI